MESGEEKRRRIAGLLSLLLLLTGLGTLAGLALFSSENSRVEVIRSRGASSEARSGSARGSGSAGEIEIVVDVAGEVEKPGVYRLSQGSRIVDALATAGGLSVQADRDFLSKTINLSQLVTDGMKIYVPAINIGNTDRTSNAGSADIANTIYINSASKEELESLWGVGAARTEAIIAGRPYSGVEELVTRKIVPKNVVEKNRSKLGI